MHVSKHNNIYCAVRCLVKRSDDSLTFPSDFHNATFVCSISSPLGHSSAFPLSFFSLLLSLLPAKVLPTLQQITNCLPPSSHSPIKSLPFVDWETLPLSELRPRDEGRENRDR